MESAGFSNTATQTEARKKNGSQPSTSQPSVSEHLILRLVPKRKKAKKGVRWAENVVDNEGLNRKSSKKCCIFHKQRNFGEWSDGEDSEEECEQCASPD